MIRYKYSWAFVLTLICVTLLAACSDNDYVSPANQAENDLVTIVESINDRDSAAIKSLLSSYFLANIEDIDSSIDEMLEFIDGEIVPMMSRSAQNVEALKKDISARIRCFITDKGTGYYIGIKRWYSYDEQPEQVGIYYIHVKNLSMLLGNQESIDAEFELDVEGE